MNLDSRVQVEEVMTEAALYDFDNEEETEIAKRRRKVCWLSVGLLVLLVLGLVSAIVYLRVNRGDRLDDMIYAAGVDERPVQIKDLIPVGISGVFDHSAKKTITYLKSE